MKKFNRTLLTGTITLLATSIALAGCNEKQHTEKVDLTASAPAGEASSLTEKNALQRLKNTLEQHFQKAKVPAKITDIQIIPNTPFYRVVLDGHTTVYATADGNFIMQGELLRLGGDKIENISENFDAELAKKELANLNEKDLIIYPAKSKKLHTIYVFSDVSCAYCQRLHQHMDEMNSKGIEVRYIAWPRGQELFPAMESIWCSEDRKKAFDDTIAGKTLAPATCKNPVQAQFELGQRLGVTGTPSIFTEDGYKIGGYVEPDNLIKILNAK